MKYKNTYSNHYLDLPHHTNIPNVTHHTNISNVSTQTTKAVLADGNVEKGSILFLTKNKKLFHRPESDIAWKTTLNNLDKVKLVVDTDGNSIIAGYIMGKWSVNENEISHGMNNISIVKINTQGKIVWTKTIKDNFNSQSIGLILDRYNDIYVSGISQYAMIAKFYANGTLSWIKYAKGNFESNIQLAYDELNHKIYWTNVLNGPGYYEFGSLNYHLSENKSVLGIAIIDSVGNWQEIHSLNDIILEDYYFIISCLGEIFISGYFQDTLTIRDKTLTGAPGLNMFILNLNDDWEVDWIFMGTSKGKISQIKLTCDDNNNLYACGFFNQPMIINNVTLTNENGLEFFILKILEGQIIQIKTIPNWKMNTGWDIQCDNDNLYIINKFEGNSKWQIPKYGETNFHHSQGNLLISKLKENGQWDWVKQLSSQNIILGIDVDFPEKLPGNVYFLEKNNNNQLCLQKLDTNQKCCPVIINQKGKKNDSVSFTIPSGPISGVFKDLKPGHYYYLDPLTNKLTLTETSVLIGIATGPETLTQFLS